MWESWQDVVIAIVGLLFGFILLPLLKDVLRGESINVYTAGLTTTGLYIMAFTFFTMKFWITFIAEMFSGTIWLLLFILSIIHKKRGIKK
jgi:hypothetical protein